MSILNGIFHGILVAQFWCLNLCDAGAGFLPIRPGFILLALLSLFAVAVRKDSLNTVKTEAPAENFGCP